MSMTKEKEPVDSVEKRYGKNSSRMNHHGAVYRYLRKRVTEAQDAVDLLTDKFNLIAELEEYFDSGAWREDFEADERGEFSHDLCRDAMTEDAVYDLLEDISQLRRKMNKFVKLTGKPKK